MPTREGALARAAGFFDGGGFRDLLAGLVAVPSTSQEEGRVADLDRYLRGSIQPWLERMGFASIHPNSVEGFDPHPRCRAGGRPFRSIALSYGRIADH